MNELTTKSQARKTAITAGIFTDSGASYDSTPDTMSELSALADAAFIDVAASVFQNKDNPDPRTFLGSGKVSELKTLIAETGAELVIFDSELSGSQTRNLEEDLDVQVIDRSTLILHIFATRAQSSEGKIQVELAQLKYLLPRLTNRIQNMSRLGGGIGTRGPGETQLETDQRHIRRRIEKLEEGLDNIVRQRSVTRKKRNESDFIRVGIVGYTNAGKSTLLNSLTNSDIFAKDMLFATLDPTTRKLSTDWGDFLLTDTVGFIDKLPHHLVNAFRSTLEESIDSDIIVHVVDASDPRMSDHMSVTAKLLSDLGVNEKPIITVFNKCDLEDAVTSYAGERCVFVSAKTGENLDKLIGMLIEIVNESKLKLVFCIPNSDGKAISYIHDSSKILSIEYNSDNVVITCFGDNKLAGMFERYRL